MLHGFSSVTTRSRLILDNFHRIMQEGPCLLLLEGKVFHIELGVNLRRLPSFPSRPRRDLEATPNRSVSLWPADHVAARTASCLCSKEAGFQSTIPRHLPVSFQTNEEITTTAEQWSSSIGREALQGLHGASFGSCICALANATSQDATQGSGKNRTLHRISGMNQNY